MAIPDFQTLMRPVLGLVLNEPKHYTACATELAPVFNLTQEEVEELLPSGRRTVLVDRVRWAIVHMKAAGIVERPSRGFILATERGRNFHKENIEGIDTRSLMHIPEYAESKYPDSRRRSRESRAEGGEHGGDAGSDGGNVTDVHQIQDTTPSERIGVAYTELNAALRVDLLEAILESSPAFFERLILDLMVALGYGGKGEHLGRSGDGGIDGSVKQDPLGLNAVYLQAKRNASDNPVDVDKVRVFTDALNEREDTAKGVFVTTSSFTRPARDRATRSTKRLVLIDGEELTRLLVKYNVGVVQDGEPLVVKKIDENYFSE